MPEATISILTERDKALVSAGYWPIDVEPRPLNAIEDARLSKEHQPDRAIYEPWVCNGYLYWQQKEVHAIE